MLALMVFIAFFIMVSYRIGAVKLMKLLNKEDLASVMIVRSSVRPPFLAVRLFGLPPAPAPARPAARSPGCDLNHWTPPTDRSKRPRTSVGR